MSKISNTSAYPNITPQGSDYLVLTDTSESNATKTVTVQALADFISVGNVTLQEVLDAGNTATENITLTGTITLTGEFVSPAGSDVTIRTMGGSGDILLIGGGTSGSVSLTGAGIAGTAEDIAFTASVGDIDLTATGVNGDIKIKAGDKAIIAGNGSSYGTQPAGTTMVYNQNDDVHINASGGLIKIGGNYPNRPTGVEIGPVSGDININAFDGLSNINLTANTGKIESHSVHDFSKDNGITLAGVAGAAGEVISSQGAGLPLAWRTALSLLTLPTSNVFTGDATSTPTATDLIKLDLAPAATFPDITIGKFAPLTLTHTTGLYYAAVTHPVGDLNLSYGFDALSQATLAGNWNTALGIAALEEVVTGNENTGVGYNAGAGIQTTHHNTALGTNALKGAAPNAVGNFNVAIGSKSMQFMNSVNADFNTAIGTLSLGSITTGQANIAIGHDAGFGITTGEANIAIGTNAMLTASVNARSNVVIGDTAGQNITTNDNTIIGANSGNTMVTGSNNVIVGHSADVPAAGVSDAVVIGSNSIGGQTSVSIGAATNAGQDSIAIGARAIASAPFSIALGNLAVASNPQTININANGAPGPVALGGLINVAVGAALPPGGVGPGDMYVVTNVTLPGSPFPCSVLCIV